LAALPCWWLTSNPLLAVVLLTGIEVAGFGPTFRSAASHPQHERIGFFMLGAARNVLAVAALEHHTLATSLFPSAKAAACVALITLVLFQRTRLRVHE
jgi:hypothetical protein